jgi:lysophospholipase L1-like esterase
VRRPVDGDDLIRHREGVQRGIALGMPGLALVAGAGVWAQVRRAVNAPLPHFDDGDPSGRYGDPEGPTVRIDVLGDSSVTGPGLRHGSDVWIAQMARRLPFSVELRSHAKGGSRVRDVLLRQAPKAVADPPDAFVVAVGANDAIHATPGALFSRDLEALLELLRAVAPVVTLGVGDLSVIPRLPATLRPLVARRSTTMDRLHEAVSAGRDGIVRVPVPELSDHHFRAAGRTIFTADQFHPNRDGHAIWAREFEPFVRHALGAAGVRRRRPQPAGV